MLVKGELLQRGPGAWAGLGREILPAGVSRVSKDRKGSGLAQLLSSIVPGPRSDYPAGQVVMETHVSLEQGFSARKKGAPYALLPANTEPLLWKPPPQEPFRTDSCVPLSLNPQALCYFTQPRTFAVEYSVWCPISTPL